MLGAAEIQRVLLRKACLDAYLDGNLWLPDETEAAQHAVSPIARAEREQQQRIVAALRHVGVDVDVDTWTRG